MNGARIEVGEGGRLSVNGDLTFISVPGVIRDGEHLIGQGATVSLDLSGVQRADSAGVALLVEWMRVAARREATLTLLNMPAQMLAIARVSGLDSILPLARS